MRLEQMIDMNAQLILLMLSCPNERFQACREIKPMPLCRIPVVMSVPKH